MPVKSWSCPRCHRDFLVDWESTRDVCPWCNAAVEEHDGAVRLVVEEREQPGTAPAQTETGAPEPAAQALWPFTASFLDNVDGPA